MRGEWQRDLYAALRHHRATVVVGETGCGKSTRVPPFLARAFPGQSVLVVEPRRLPCIKITEYLCELEDWTLGHEVGIAIGRFVRTSPACRVTYATARTALHLLSGGKSCFPYSIVVLDEVHERDLSTELFAAAVRLYCRTNPRVRVVVMSATISAQYFANFLAFPPLAGETDIEPTNSIASLNAGADAVAQTSGPRTLTSAPVVHMSTTFGGHPVTEIGLGDEYPSLSRVASDIAAKIGRVDQKALSSWRSAFIIPTADYERNVVGVVASVIRDAVVADGAGPLALAAAAQRVTHLVSGPGGILVFLPAMDMIRKVIDALSSTRVAADTLPAGLVMPGGDRRRDDGSFSLAELCDVHVLHSSISSEALAATAGGACATGKRRVILSTNLAETSLTIPDVTLVIDTGLSRFSRQSSESMRRLETVLATDQARTQRRGRAGRVGPGVYVDLRPKDLHQFAFKNFRPELEKSHISVQLSSDIADLFATHVDPEFFFDGSNQLSSVSPRDITTAMNELAAAGYLRSVALSAPLESSAAPISVSMRTEDVPLVWMNGQNPMGRMLEADGRLSEEALPLAPVWSVRSSLDGSGTPIALVRGRAVFAVGRRLVTAITASVDERLLIRTERDRVLAVLPSTSAASVLSRRRARAPEYMCRVACDVDTQLLQMASNAAVDEVGGVVEAYAALPTRELDGVLAAAAQAENTRAALCALLAGATPQCVDSGGNHALAGVRALRVVKLCAQVSRMRPSDLADRLPAEPLSAGESDLPQGGNWAAWLAAAAAASTLTKIGRFDPHYRDQRGNTLAQLLTVACASDLRFAAAAAAAGDADHLPGMAAPSLADVHALLGVAAVLDDTVVYRQRSGALFVDEPTGDAKVAQLSTAALTPAKGVTAIPGAHLAVAPTVLGAITGALPVEPTESHPCAMMAMAGLPVLGAMLVAAKRENALVGPNEIGMHRANVASAVFSVWPPAPLSAELSADAAATFSEGLTTFRDKASGVGQAAFVRMLRKLAPAVFSWRPFSSALAAATLRVAFPEEPLSMTSSPAPHVAAWAAENGITVAGARSLELFAASIIDSLAKYGLAPPITDVERSVMYSADAGALPNVTDWRTMEMDTLVTAFRFLREINDFILRMSGVDVLAAPGEELSERDCTAVSAAVALLENICAFCVGGAGWNCFGAPDSRGALTFSLSVKAPHKNVRDAITDEVAAAAGLVDDCDTLTLSAVDGEFFQTSGLPVSLKAEALLPGVNSAVGAAVGRFCYADDALERYPQEQEPEPEQEQEQDDGLFVVSSDDSCYSDASYDVSDSEAYSGPLSAAVCLEKKRPLPRTNPALLSSLTYLRVARMGSFKHGKATNILAQEGLAIGFTGLYNKVSSPEFASQTSSLLVFASAALSTVSLVSSFESSTERLSVWAQPGRMGGNQFEGIYLQGPEQLISAVRDTLVFAGGAVEDIMAPLALTPADDAAVSAALAATPAAAGALPDFQARPSARSAATGEVFAELMAKHADSSPQARLQAALLAFASLGASEAGYQVTFNTIRRKPPADDALLLVRHARALPRSIDTSD